MLQIQFPKHLIGNSLRIPFQFTLNSVPKKESIKLRMRKLLPNHLIGNNCPEFHNGLLDSYVFQTDFVK